MILREAAYLTDENAHADIAAFLRGEGGDVLAVRESGLHGTSDVLLLRRAFAERRIILPHDSDFGTLAIANSEPIFGIVYLRPGHPQAEQTLETLRTLLAQNFDPAPPFLLIAKRTDTTVAFLLRSL